MQKTSSRTRPTRMDPSRLLSLLGLVSSVPHDPAASHRATRRAAHEALAFPARLSVRTHDSVARPNRTNLRTTSPFPPVAELEELRRGCAVSMHSAESWHGSGRQITCHPFGIASAAVIFACPSHLPGTVSFDRYLETNLYLINGIGPPDPNPVAG